MSFVATASAHRVREVAGTRLPAAALGFGVAPVLAAGGCYYPTSWGWAGVALAWGAVVGAALGANRKPEPLQLVFLAGLGAFAVWSALSAIWGTGTDAGLEVERTLVYVAAVLAVQTLVRRRHIAVLLGGVCLGTVLVCAYALFGRLFPSTPLASDLLTGDRLAGPIGYWNGLAVVAAMGTLLALGLAARGGSYPARALGGAAVPVLLVTQYFTYSRGGWISLFVALAVFVAVDRRRLQLVAAGGPILLASGLLVWRASGMVALTHAGRPLAATQHDGRQLALFVLLAAVVCGYTAVLVRQGERAVSVPPRVRIVVGGALSALALAALGVTFAHFGSPQALAKRAYHSFTRGSSGESTNLNSRLFTLWSNGRVAEWKVAWRAFRTRPITGIGAGGYETYWNRHRTIPGLKVRDAHNLYVETLAETGVVGAALLFAALAVPLIGFWRARREPLAAAALAAYVAYLVEAAADWDWELAGVTFVALLCGGAVLAAGRQGKRPTRRGRLLPLSLGTAVGAAALFGLVGNLALAASGSASASGDLERAASQARRAQFWVPWSAEPWQRLGEAQIALGQDGRARRSIRTAISKAPDDAALWLDLAEASSGRDQRAALNRARVLSPFDTSISDLAKLLHGRPAFSKGQG